MEEVYNFINGLNISEDDVVVLACSYGPDSMCLLDVLNKMGLKVIVAHVNHKLRKVSDKEYKELESYCKNNNLVFEGTEILDKPHGNVENFFRKFRYDFFAKVVKKYDAKYLFTAHHADDLIETILMKISRGASFGGYAGFKAFTKLDNYYLVRPLIYVTKDDILAYVKINHIPYAIDESNLTNDYTRNKYRHEVLPALKDINSNAHKKFLKFSNTINEYNDYLEEETNTLYTNLYKGNRIDLNEFNILPLLLKKSLLRKVLFEIYKDKISLITDNHINLLLELIDSYKVNSCINLPNNVLVSRYYNILEFGENKKISDYDYVFHDEVNDHNHLFFYFPQILIYCSIYLLIHYLVNLYKN